MINQRCGIQITSLMTAMQMYTNMAVRMLTKGIPSIHLCLIKKEFSDSQRLRSPTKDCSGFELVKQSELFNNSFFMDTLLYCSLCHDPLQGPPAWKLENIKLLEVVKQGWAACINGKSHSPRCLRPTIRTMSISCKEKIIL